MKFTKEQRHAVYEKLSEEAQSFVTSDENIGIIEKLSEEYHLDANKSDTLDSEVYFAMIGLISLEDLSTNLTQELGLTPEQTTLLISSLNNQIFSLIKQMQVTGHFFANDTPQTLPVEIANHLVSTPTGLMSGGSILPEIQTPEAQIMPLVGSPGEKLAWERRKQKLGELETPNSTYGTVDPYREPLQ